MKKQRMIAVLVLALLMSVSVYVASVGAQQGLMPRGGMHKNMGYMSHKMDKGKERDKKGLDEKLFHKIKFVLKNEDELGLSDKQIDKIKSLKMKTKKTLIMKKAEIEIIAIDIKAALDKEKVDVRAVEKLIDQKYDLKKTKAKVLVNAYASFKDILTKDQKDKMKSLWKQCGQKKQCKRRRK